MSTTGNEYERPGVNQPDRADADGAAGTPAAGDPTRDEKPSPPAPEPSHTAVGIGVIGSEEGMDHHGQDGGRDTLTAGEAQRTPGALGTEQEQRLPAMSQNDASEVDKVAGIVAQTRQDVGTDPVERIADVLRQRLEQSGIDLPEDEIEELAHQVATGDSKSPRDS